MHNTWPTFYWSYVWDTEAQCDARLGPISWSAGRHTPLTRDNGSRSTALVSSHRHTNFSLFLINHALQFGWSALSITPSNWEPLIEGKTRDKYVLQEWAIRRALGVKQSGYRSGIGDLEINYPKGSRDEQATTHRYI